MSGETKALPSDFWMARHLFIDVDPRITLEQVSLNMLRTAYATKRTGQPRVYAISGSTLYLGPSPDTTDNLILDYYQTIPALDTGQATNWLLTAHPDVYLYGTLVQAEAYLDNDARLPVWKRALDDGLLEIMEAGKRKRYGAAPIRLRSPVMWNC
jgi:hypothetical protein